MIDEFKKIGPRLLLLKEGAVVGLIIGLLIYFVKIKPVLVFIQTWFGPLTATQLLITTLFITVSLGIIVDSLWKPRK